MSTPPLGVPTSPTGPSEMPGEASRDERLAAGDFQAIFEHATTGMAIVSSTGRFLAVNPAFCAMLGYSPQELLQTPAVNITHAGDHLAVAQRMEQLKGGTTTSYPADRRWLHKSGQVVPAVEGVCAVRGSLEPPSQFLLQLIEVQQPDRRILEQLASERKAAVSQLAIGLAHESRNALQQIGACAEMLAMELAGSPEALDLVSGMQEAEGRLHRMFEDLRVYAVPLHFERRRCEIPELWRNAWAALLTKYPQRELELSEDVSAESRYVIGAPRYLEQAFLKIFENSLDACKDPVKIELRCWAAPSGTRHLVAVSVRDSGTGFARDAIDRALEPFFSTKTQGTGLGLPIVRRIVEAHQGEVHVANGTVGGAVVQFTLLGDT